MAITNFAALTQQQKLVWSKDVWKAAREKTFINKFIGDDENNVIQRITELTRTEKGEQCIMHLVADLVGDGVVGDDEREGMEEALQSYNDIISIDLISHGVTNKGKLSDQKSVIKFREQGRDKLSYWLANRIDQLAFLTLSSIDYSFNNDGSIRVGSSFPKLSFAKDIIAPTSKRLLVWNNTNSNFTTYATNASTTVNDTVSYKMFTKALAYAKDHYIKPLTAGGKEFYVFFVKPGTIAQLKNDSTYMNAVVQAAPRDMNNPFFTGAVVTLDGAIIHESRLVYSTTGAASGSKWGALSAIEGTRTLLCGAQALGMADLGAPQWSEKEFQYESRQGINTDKMFGLLKPQFYSIYDKSIQDFGAICIDHALS